mmetsp:Transcript_31884/g.51659  ORF Transcript_31884/g.51659 Transcript_31884/m.51659 type:complete len:90 (+) Transcript_31884:70-339(+)
MISATLNSTPANLAIWIDLPMWIPTASSVLVYSSEEGGQRPQRPPRQHGSVKKEGKESADDNDDDEEEEDDDKNIDNFATNSDWIVGNK